MKIIVEGLENFEPWSGAVSNWREIQDLNKVGELEDILENAYPDGMSETEINDFIWFEEETWRDWLDMEEEDEEEDEEEEEEE